METPSFNPETKQIFRERAYEKAENDAEMLSEMESGQLERLELTREQKEAVITNLVHDLARFRSV